MIRKFIFTLVIGAIALPASVVSAAGLQASFDFQGTVDDAVFTGIVEAAPFDLYYLNVTNNEAVDIFTFNDLVLSGPWLQATVTAQAGTDLVLSTLDQFLGGIGDNFNPDTFFAGAGGITPTLLGAVVDDGATLSATTTGLLGGPWVSVGATETIAVLSVPVGTVLGENNYLGGGGIIGPNVVPLTFAAIPEPGTLMLAGLGLFGVFARRRRSL